MFIKLLHGLQGVLGAVLKYLQLWTDEDVPDGTLTTHDFKDGRGKVTAIPYDVSEASNAMESVYVTDTHALGSDSATQGGEVLKVSLRTELANGGDSMTDGSVVEKVECDPNPILFEIQNNVPDKIVRIIPVKTQALPNQDFVFRIVYVKDYTYVDGDIMPVFGDWASYVGLSKDGEFLTVNSAADLTVRLILTPAPQGWDNSKPDPDIVQESTDKTLSGVPKDGSVALYDLGLTSLDDEFYTVSVENLASNLVTNSGFADGARHVVDAESKEIAIPMTFAERIRAKVDLLGVLRRPEV